MRQDIAFGNLLRESGIKGALKRAMPKGVVFAIKKAKVGVTQR